MMFSMKLSVLTLLIAALVSLISAENVITCYFSVQRLRCETGMINVQSSIYGRTDSSVCSAGRPSSQTQKTDCSLRIPLISDRCNGQKVCEFKTDLLGSPDPCYGTYKYYNTTYDCVQGRDSVLCGDGYSTLDCGNDVIQIYNANYGRTDRITCSDGLPRDVTENTNCYYPATLATVAGWCDGQSRCTLEVSSNIFTDPCIGTAKYLAVSYFCIPHPVDTSVTCEGNTTELTCESGVLKIRSANYGRTDSTTCSAGRPANQITKTNCYAFNTLTEVVKRCDGKSSCQVPATNDVFSDPCFGTYKYLRIVYSCMVNK